jgi:hypothetical protein
MGMYAKLFSCIYSGSLRGKPHDLLVFTNLLAHCDYEGVVDRHPRAIADEVGLTVDQVRAALERLESPDPESRSPDHEGRRIVRIDAHRDWGWRVVNFARYRAMRDEDDRRAQTRAAVSRHRERVEVRGTRLPDDWQPTPDLIAWARAQCPGVDLAHETAMFVDYWRAQPGQRGVKLDWPATWRNWVRKAYTEVRRRGGRSRQTLPERMAAAAAERHARDARVLLEPVTIVQALDYGHD